MVSATKIPFPCANPLASRALSALEFFIGAFIVIGHNVFHVVPNEVIVLCLLGLSILFGSGHYYKGPSGIIDSGIAGLILGTAYMVAGRNLWASILTHGMIDTFEVIDAFFGWSK